MKATTNDDPPQEAAAAAALKTRQWKVPRSHEAHHPEKGELTFTALVTGDDDDDNNKQRAATKEVVVCWHGFPDTNHTFEPLLKSLVARDEYIVIAPKLPGYEESSHLGRGRYSVLEVAQQVIAFIKVVLKEYKRESVHFIGHDWGAVVGFCACQLEPTLMKSFVNIAIPFSWRVNACVGRFPRQVLYSWYIFFFQLPLIPQYVVSFRNFQFLNKLWNDWSPAVPRSDDDPKSTTQSSSLSLSYYLDLVKKQFQNRFILLNALDYYRCMIRGLLLFRPAARKTDLLMSGRDACCPQEKGFPVPTLAIGGARDGCIMSPLFQATFANKQKDFPRGLEMLVVENAGHFVHLEEPDVVNRRIAAFLKKFE